MSIPYPHHIWYLIVYFHSLSPECYTDRDWRRDWHMHASLHVHVCAPLWIQYLIAQHSHYLIYLIKEFSLKRLVVGKQDNGRDWISAMRVKLPCSRYPLHLLFIYLSLKCIYQYLHIRYSDCVGKSHCAIFRADRLYANCMEAPHLGQSTYEFTMIDNRCFEVYT